MVKNTLGMQISITGVQSSGKAALEHRKTKCDWVILYWTHPTTRGGFSWCISVSTTRDEASGITVLSATTRTASKPFQKINNPKKTPHSLPLPVGTCTFEHQTAQMTLLLVKKERNNHFGSFIYNFFQLPLQLEWTHWTPLTCRE